MKNKNHIKFLSRVLTVALMFPILSFSRSEDCSAATYWNGESCVKIPSGMQKSLLSNTDSLSCLNEYVWIDSKKNCIALPANAELYEENGKPTFMCIDGYSSDGLRCIKTPLCNDQQVLNNLKCIQIPKGAEKVDDSIWVCSLKYYKDKDKCKHIPIGMAVNELGVLICDDGYYKDKKGCSRIPENAIVVGNDSWECIDGYFKDGLNCVEIPEHGFIGISEKLQCDVGYLIKQKLCVPDQDRFVFGFIIGGVRTLLGCEESETTAYYHKTGESEYAWSSERYNVKQTPLTVVKYSVSCLADSGWATNTIETIEACYKNDTLISLYVVAPSEHKEFVKKKLNKRYKKISEKKSKSFDGSASIFTEYRGTKYVDVSVGEDWAIYWIWYQYRPIDNVLMREADSLYLKGY